MTRTAGYACHFEMDLNQASTVDPVIYALGLFGNEDPTTWIQVTPDLTSMVISNGQHLLSL
jgi:hypothetical protein